jgi:hypothetical protein
MSTSADPAVIYVKEEEIEQLRLQQWLRLLLQLRSLCLFSTLLHLFAFAAAFLKR